ncbi:ribonuclease T(2) [Mycobacterium sp. TY814]|uniref:ribonuclease T2 family protein n=1 Tax=unclassified Mycobacterium TaxID=2642494 RepID=UPI0027403922|nr:ribonuclease T(2) [Mycobacterium sp. TY814]MDP7722755.1 ribonuclease T(2) [Mycobacterium sp. TY814]
MTWAPSLCKVASSSPGCANGHVRKMGRTLILHGLWPQPASEQFCGVPGHVAGRPAGSPADKSPTLTLPEDVQMQLQSIMSDATAVAPHEWYRHGTCSGVTPVAYFGNAISLTEQVRKTLDPVFETAAGGQLSADVVRDRVDAEFGRGSGARVGLKCRSVEREGLVVYEVRLSFPPVAELGHDGRTVTLSDALGKGPTIPAGCRSGRVP